MNLRWLGTGGKIIKTININEGLVIVGKGGKGPVYVFLLIVNMISVIEAYLLVFVDHRRPHCYQNQSNKARRKQLEECCNRSAPF